MKKITTLTMFLLLLITASSFAEDGGKKVKQINENTIQSLIIELQSDNVGLRTSSAYLLGELKVTRAIIPLMKVLKNCDCEEARIASALALYKIGTPLAIFAVKQAGIFDESKRVKKLASTFYFEYLRNKNSENETPGSLFAQR